MENKADCLVRINNLLPNMHDTEKRIAQIILDNPDEITHMPVKRISQMAGVAESSIVRFCQKLGYKGISDLKINLARSIMPANEITISEISQYDSPREIAQKIYNSSKKALDDTLTMLDFDAYEKAVVAILSAKRIEFYGIGTSAQIAYDAYYRFMRVGFPAFCATDPHISRISSSLLTKNDLAVAISHTGRTIDTIRTLEIAKEAGATTLCITSYLQSPITEIADICLVTTTAETQYLREAVSSRIAQIALLDALYTTVSVRRNNKVFKHLNKMKDILSETRL